MSDAGRAFQLEILAVAFGKKITGRVAVKVTLYPPNRQKRDIDNYTKVLLDGITKARVWEDDECVDLLTIARGQISRPNGYCTVEIVSLEGD